MLSLVGPFKDWLLSQQLATQFNFNAGSLPSTTPQPTAQNSPLPTPKATLSPKLEPLVSAAPPKAQSTQRPTQPLSQSQLSNRPQVSPTSATAIQGSTSLTLEGQLKRAVDNQQWDQAVRVVDQMLIATPSRSPQLNSYRQQLASLAQSAGMSVPPAAMLSQGGSSQASPIAENITYVDWDPWLSELRYKVSENWDASSTSGSRSASVSFTVDREGKVLKTKVSRSSGSAKTDNEVLTAIRRSSPFAPLPSEYPNPSVEVNFSFYINGASGWSGEVNASGNSLSVSANKSTQQTQPSASSQKSLSRSSSMSTIDRPIPTRTPRYFGTID